MALLDGSVLPASSPASPQLDTTLPHLSRKRRMNFFDIANLLDSDGNLQNEMMVFAFAATMLSTIPILLGNEFDINVGLKRKRREAAGAYKDPNEGKTLDFPHDRFTPRFPYKTLMISEEDPYNSHSHENPSKTETREQSVEEPTDTWMNKLLRNLLQWSQKVSIKKSPFSNLITSLLHRYKSNQDDVDEFVVSIYEKWRKYWYQ